MTKIKERDVWTDDQLKEPGPLEFPPACTYDEAQAVFFRHFANKSTKSAILLRDYLRYFLNRKFCRQYEPYWHHVGRARMEKWAPLVKKVSTIIPLQPMITVKDERKLIKEIKSKNLVEKDHFKTLMSIKQNTVEESLRKFDEATKKSREDLLKSREERRQSRQKAIDIINNERLDNYAKQLEDYNRNRNENLVSLSNVEITRHHRKNKDVFIGTYSNSYRKNITPTAEYEVLPDDIKDNKDYIIVTKVTHHCPVDTVRWECRSRFCKVDSSRCQHGPSWLEEIEDHESCKYRGHICPETIFNTTYYAFKIEDFNIVDITQTTVPKPESVELLKDAQLSQTEIIQYSVSSFGIPQIKSEHPYSTEQAEAWKVVEKSRRDLSKFKRNYVLENIKNSKEFVQNRFIVLQNFRAELESQRSANYVRESQPIDNDSRTKSSEYNKYKNKQTKKCNKIRERSTKMISEMNKSTRVEKRMLLKDVIVCILNTRLHNMLNIDKSKGFDDNVLNTYLIQGYLDRKCTKFNKGHRKIMTRLLSEVIDEIIK
jgi:hypothetical protein